MKIDDAIEKMRKPRVEISQKYKGNLDQIFNYYKNLDIKYKERLINKDINKKIEEKNQSETPPNY